MATNSNITVPPKYATKYKNVVYGWDTSHPTTISKKFIILIYHYLHAVIAKQDAWLKPESIVSISAISKGAPKAETMFLEASPLDRGRDSFISAPHGLVDLDNQECFTIKI